MITITRRHLRHLINEATNYASLEHQGMNTLRKIIVKTISEEDIKRAVGQLVGVEDGADMTPLNIAIWMMSYYNNYYDKIASKIRQGHPSLDAMMIDNMKLGYQRRPQEIDRFRIAKEVAEIYGDLITYYVDYFLP